MGQERDLPLFPLNTVLFPGANLPLQIFEERYKKMMSDIAVEDHCFGVVLIREGREVGQYATPHDVGTVAEVVETAPLGQGRIYVVGQGIQRFRVQSLSYDEPYLMGRVTILDPLVDDTTQEIVQESMDVLEAYTRAMMRLQGGWVREVEVPDEPSDLSDALITILRAGRRTKQRFLEMDSLQERLTGAATLIRRDMERIQAEIREKGLTHRFGEN